jgi:maltooligosyltrehalose trehalohydrolase
MDRVKAEARSLVLTSPFVPMLFQGEDWGASTPFFYFTDH